MTLSNLIARQLMARRKSHSPGLPPGDYARLHNIEPDVYARAESADPNLNIADIEKILSAFEIHLTSKSPKSAAEVYAAENRFEVLIAGTGKHNVMVQRLKDAIKGMCNAVGQVDLSELRLTANLSINGDPVVMNNSDGDHITTLDTGKRSSAEIVEQQFAGHSLLTISSSTDLVVPAEDLTPLGGFNAVLGLNKEYRPIEIKRSLIKEFDIESKLEYNARFTKMSKISFDNVSSEYRLTGEDSNKDTYEVTIMDWLGEEPIASRLYAEDGTLLGYKLFIIKPNAEKKEKAAAMRHNLQQKLSQEISGQVYDNVFSGIKVLSARAASQFRNVVSTDNGYVMLVGKKDETGRVHNTRVYDSMLNVIQVLEADYDYGDGLESAS